MTVATPMVFGDVLVDDLQVATHVVTEAGALLVVVPFMAWLATRPYLPVPARLLAGALGLGTLLVDGGLLLRWQDAWE